MPTCQLFNELKSHLQNIITVREVVLDSLKGIDDLCTIAPADGAFYCFLKVETLHATSLHKTKRTR